MNLAKVVEFLVSDVLTASAISAVFLLISQKAAKVNEKNQEKNLQEIKDHLDLRLEVIEAKLETKLANSINEIKK